MSMHASVHRNWSRRLRCFPPSMKGRTSSSIQAHDGAEGDKEYTPPLQRDRRAGPKASAAMSRRSSSSSTLVCRVGASSRAPSKSTRPDRAGDGGGSPSGGPLSFTVRRQGAEHRPEEQNCQQNPYRNDGHQPGRLTGCAVYFICGGAQVRKDIDRDELQHDDDATGTMMRSSR